MMNLKNFPGLIPPKLGRWPFPDPPTRRRAQGRPKLPPNFKSWLRPCPEFIFKIVLPGSIVNVSVDSRKPNLLRATLMPLAPAARNVQLGLSKLLSPKMLQFSYSEFPSDIFLRKQIFLSYELHAGHHCNDNYKRRSKSSLAGGVNLPPGPCFLNVISAAPLLNPGAVSAVNSTETFFHTRMLICTVMALGHLPPGKCKIRFMNAAVR
jgi:hypothetical protein